MNLNRDQLQRLPFLIREHFSQVSWERRSQSSLEKIALDMAESILFRPESELPLMVALADSFPIVTKYASPYWWIT